MAKRPRNPRAENCARNALLRQRFRERSAARARNPPLRRRRTRRAVARTQRLFAMDERFASERSHRRAHLKLQNGGSPWRLDSHGGEWHGTVAGGDRVRRRDGARENPRDARLHRAAGIRLRCGDGAAGAPHDRGHAAGLRAARHRHAGRRRHRAAAGGRSALPRGHDRASRARAAGLRPRGRGLPRDAAAARADRALPRRASAGASPSGASPSSRSRSRARRRRCGASSRCGPAPPVRALPTR